MPKRCPVDVYDEREIQTVVEYIDYLEGQEDRLRGMEGALNKISSSNMSNRDNFLREFKPFIVENKS